jgi:hypothetical protein
MVGEPTITRCRVHCSVAGRQSVQHSSLRVGDQVGQLSEAHLDALVEVIGDYHATLVGRVRVDPQLWATAVALSTERGDFFHVARWGVLDCHVICPL